MLSKTELDQYKLLSEDFVACSQDNEYVSALKSMSSKLMEGASSLIYFGEFVEAKKVLELLNDIAKDIKEFQNIR